MKKEASKAGTVANNGNTPKTGGTPNSGGGGGGTGTLTPTGTSTPPSVGSVGGAHTPGPIKSERNTPTLEANPASNASQTSGSATPTQPKIEAPDTPLGVNGDASNPGSNALGTPSQPENNGSSESIGGGAGEDVKPPLGLNSGANTPNSSASATPNHNSGAVGSSGSGNNSGSGPQGADADFLDQFDSKDGGKTNDYLLIPVLFFSSSTYVHFWLAYKSIDRMTFCFSLCVPVFPLARLSITVVGVLACFVSKFTCPFFPRGAHAFCPLPAAMIGCVMNG